MGEEKETLHLSKATLTTVLFMIIYTAVGPILRKKSIKFINENSITMLSGIILTIIIKAIYPNSIFYKGFSFNNVFFFTFVLPMIVFSMGYNLRRDLFFRNFRYIILFSIFGSFLSFLVNTLFLYIVNNKGYMTYYSFEDSTFNNKISLTLSEILLFSVSLSVSDDSLATFSMFNQETDQKLISITFGEGILNSGICISMFNIILGYHLDKGELNLTAKLIWNTLKSTLIYFIESFILGTIVGCLCSLFLKRLKLFKLNRVQEISILILFGFISYIISDFLYLNSIVSVLSCGIFLSHYTFYNLSYQSREESYSILSVLDILANGFTFAFLGLTAFSFLLKVFSIRFLLINIFLIFLNRFLTIFVSIWIMRIFSSEDFQLKLSKRLILIFSGSLRGAISFALVISMKTSSEINKDFLISGIISVVLITNFIFYGIYPYLFKIIKSVDSTSMSPVISSDSLINIQKQGESLFNFKHPNFNEQFFFKKSKKNIENLQEQISYWLTHYWVEFDNVCLKKKLIYNWPEVKEDNDNLTKKIIMEMNKYVLRKNKDYNESIDTALKTELLLVKDENNQSHNSNSSEQLNSKSSPINKGKTEMKEFYSNEKNLSNDKLFYKEKLNFNN